MYPPVYVCLFVSLSLSVHLFVYLCLFIRLSLHVYLSVSVCLHVCLSLSLRLSLFVYLPVSDCPFVYLICLFVFLCPSICLSLPVHSLVLICLFLPVYQYVLPVYSLAFVCPFARPHLSTCLFIRPPFACLYPSLRLSLPVSPPTCLSIQRGLIATLPLILFAFRFRLKSAAIPATTNRVFSCPRPPPSEDLAANPLTAAPTERRPAKGEEGRGTFLLLPLRIPNRPNYSPNGCALVPIRRQTKHCLWPAMCDHVRYYARVWHSQNGRSSGGTPSARARGGASTPQSGGKDTDSLAGPACPGSWRGAGLSSGPPPVEAQSQ